MTRTGATIQNRNLLAGFAIIQRISEVVQLPQRIRNALGPFIGKSRLPRVRLRQVIVAKRKAVGRGS